MTMFQKMLILSFVFCAWASFATAQDPLKVYSAVAPKELAGSHIDGLLEGKTKLKSGREVKWGLMYDKKEQKPMMMTFVCPDDVNKKVFDADIQAMTIGQFWNGIGNCIITYSNNSNAAINCIQILQQTALSDCIRTESTADCWMINR